MLFTTDKQTLEDLNIFGRHGGESIYNIFNRCATRGGAALLEEMFRYPLSDEKAINNRSYIIRFFAASGMRFPFNSAHFDAITPYLANTDERSRLSTDGEPISRRLGNIIGVDAQTQLIHKGVQALAALLKDARTFVQAIQLPAHHPYQADKDAISAILEEPAFEPVLNSSTKLTHATIAGMDGVLRFRYRDTLLQLLRYIYMLDVYMAIAGVAVEKQFAFAEALPRGGPQARLEGVYHPQVKNAVANDIVMEAGSNVVFLTGANMAGKSTFMKSLSITLFLAHMGFPVPAKKMEFAVLDGIYTTINLPDNLGMGASHFYAEVLRVKKMAGELGQGKHLFIVFDELFRGTNVKDAYEATIAITQGFAGMRNSLFVISTHIIEAGEVLRQASPNVRFLYLPTRMNGHQPVYTYTLEEGITDDRHGMVIINNEGILDLLEAGIKHMKLT